MIRSNGNVGIDNDNPYYKLGVNGTIYCENIITGSAVNASDGSIELGKNNGSGGNRKMKLHYNSSFEMCISDAGNNSSSTITTPFKIAYSAPADSLVINGSGDATIHNKLKFSNGTVISHGLVCFKVRPNTTGDIALASQYVTPSSQFSSGNIIYNVGTFTIDSSGRVVIPITGYYQIHVNAYYECTTGDRASMLTTYAINGVRQTNDFAGGTYIRFNSGDRGSRNNNGTFLQYFTAGDNFVLVHYETADSTNIRLFGTNSTVNFVKVG